MNNLKRRKFIGILGGSIAAGIIGTKKILKSNSQNVKVNPNVVIIYGDDVGYGDVGIYGSKLIPTPNIDKFATESLQLFDAHCTAATCTPSRFSLLTGVHGFRNNVRILRGDAKMCISTNTFTLPKLFKKAGYTTSVIGKWHLGLGDGVNPVDWNGDIKPGPLEIGFDYSFLIPATNDRVPCVYVENHQVVNLDPNDPITVNYKKPLRGTYPIGKENPESMTYYKNSHGHNQTVINGIGRIGYMSGGKSALWNDETMADELVKRTRTFISKNKDKPFFLYFASQDIHVPRTPHPRFQGKTKLGYRGDAMVQFDWTTGEILKSLEENGLTENTIVIFTSDNGPVYDDGYRDGTTVKKSGKGVASDKGHFAAGPYCGGKYQIYEGGTRIPFIIRWPGKIKPGTSKALISQIDFMSSFAELLGIQLPDNAALDSRNSLSVLLGEDRENGSDFIIEESRELALRMGAWKYIMPRKKSNTGEVLGKLYNLDEDIAEKNNLITKFPEKAKKMCDLLIKLKNKGRIRE